MELEQLHSYWKVQSFKLEIKKIALGVVFGLLVAFLNPYGSDGLQDGLAQTLYWVGACVLGLLIARPIALLTFAYSVKKNHSAAMAFALFTAVASFPVFVLIVLGDITITGADPRSWSQIVALVERENMSFFDFVVWYFEVLFICVLLFGFITYLTHKTEAIPGTSAAVSSPGTHYMFFKKLPADLGQNLICLSMEDHYIRVYTDKGDHLLLMRFKDAVEALEGYAGFQTHRSWWVASNAIINTEKDKRRHFLVLSNDMKVPVSQTYQGTLKEQGFL